MQADDLRRNVLQEICHHACNNNGFTVGTDKETCIQCVCHDTPQTTSPFTDAVINEALWQCEPLQHDRLLQLINGVKLPAVVDLLLRNSINSVIHRI